MNPSPTMRAHVLLAGALLIAAVAGWRFRAQWRPEPLYPSAGRTRQALLSDYHAPLRGTAFDTEVFVFDSSEPGGTLLICGGTHPNEPAAYLAAVTILENLRVTHGRVIVIPRANNAAFSHNDSQDAALQRYRIPTAHGLREFRNGSRYTNPVRQWPDPTIYVNPRGAYWDEITATCPTCAINNPGPGGQTLGGVDARNLNRVYPGDPHGTMTEQVGHAIVTLIRQENVNLAIDLHEAAPEYPTINVMVAHQRAGDVASWAELLLADDGVRISTDASAMNLRGLSHREWGDASLAVMPVLFESANVAQGRLKGATSEDQIIKGIDASYQRVQRIQAILNERLAREAKEAEDAGRTVGEGRRRILYVDIPTLGIPIEERVGRHVQATVRLVQAYDELAAGPTIDITSLPNYAELRAQGVGAFLHGPDGQAPRRIAGEGD